MPRTILELDTKPKCTKSDVIRGTASSQAGGYGWHGGPKSGGRFQWVLDAACEAGEWLHQPLQFESAALRAVTHKNNLLLAS